MNAHCAIYGHDWFFRHAIRLLMCRRCMRIDVDSPRSAVTRPVPPVAGSGAARGAVAPRPA